MKKIVLTTLGLMLSLSIGLSSKDEVNTAKTKDGSPIIQYSHADHF
ncbi:hypothetical protein PDN14_26920 [Bacillus cereus group sp. Bc222]|nr:MULTISPECIES: hypothetical protein [Bacillus cereus group]MDA2242007.1 hypothetical protein [Bacillus cereus group sp. Bc222]MEB9505261.1 hypothetical protein [Bacillus anthracis]